MRSGQEKPGDEAPDSPCPHANERRLSALCAAAAIRRLARARRRPARSCRTRHGGATRRPARCAPWARGPATDRCPRGRPARGHRWNRCGRRRHPPGRRRSCPAGRAYRWPRRFRRSPRNRRPAPRRRRVHHVAVAPVVVFDAPFALLRLGDGDVEVEIEIAAQRRRPGKAPPHPPLIGLELGERRARHRP